MTIDEKLDHIIHLLERKQYSYKEIDPDDGLRKKITENWDFRDKLDRDYLMTASEVLAVLGFEDRSKRMTNKCARILTELLGEKSRKTTNGRRVWLMPTPKIIL